jgi:LSD1 subclass zinc finger protein
VRLETIACNQCGAPLSVPEAAQFVRCNHCAASLAVRRNESVTYTEVVEKLVAHTSKLAGQIAHLRFQNELERIDREWEYEREGYLVKQKDGSLVEPSRASAIFFGVIFAIIGLIEIVITIAAGGWPFAVFGVVIALIGFGSAVSGARAADAFKRARARYRRERSSLNVEDFLADAGHEPDAVDDITPLR